MSEHIYLNRKPCFVHYRCNKKLNLVQTNKLLKYGFFEPLRARVMHRSVLKMPSGLLSAQAITNKNAKIRVRA